jgi:hypothetical protein
MRDCFHQHFLHLLSYVDLLHNKKKPCHVSCYVIQTFLMFGVQSLRLVRDLRLPVLRFQLTGSGHEASPS